jgi:UDP-N-acetylglucosamine 2-epimerase (non-hydrolysing)
MFQAIHRILLSYPHVKALFPIHLNPAVRQLADQVLGDCHNILIIEPLGVYDFHNIMKRSYLILTDSGGIQEEASALGKPVLVMRDHTERTEGLEAGTLKLVGTNEQRIYDECAVLLTDAKAYEQMSRSSLAYGDGHASERIVKVIEQYFRQTCEGL